MKEIKFNVCTLSNLLIGGNESSFVIGGIDQHTVTDYNDCPYIPGSSFKGAFRKIVRDDKNELISEIFRDYVNNLIEEAERKVTENPDININLKKFEEHIKKGIISDSEYMFGINGYNQSPKLMFSDLYLTEKSREKGDYFSIDAKNSIDDKTLVANPRTYKVARQELVFTGSIRFRNFEKLEARKDEIQNYVIAQLKVFDEGFYRLGNSKSRGYGHIKVVLIEVDGKKVGGF